MLPSPGCEVSKILASSTEVTFALFLALLAIFSSCSKFFFETLFRVNPPAQGFATIQRITFLFSNKELDSTTGIIKSFRFSGDKSIVTVYVFLWKNQGLVNKFKIPTTLAKSPLFLLQNYFRLYN